MRVVIGTDSDVMNVRSLCLRRKILATKRENWCDMQCRYNSVQQVALPSTNLLGLMCDCARGYVTYMCACCYIIMSIICWI
jgi:hypothetical protein